MPQRSLRNAERPASLDKDRYKQVMDGRQRALYHQIHPAKLTTDILTAVIGLALLWKHRLMPALVVMLIPPIVATALVMRWGHLEHLARTLAGSRMHRMSSLAIALRLFGMLVMSIGAWRAEPALIATGGAIIVAVWTWVLR